MAMPKSQPKTMPKAKAQPKAQPQPKTKPKPKTQPKPKTMQERIVELRTRREEVIAGGGEKRHAKQHAAGKLTARERIAELVDPLSSTAHGENAAE